MLRELTPLFSHGSSPAHQILIIAGENVHSRYFNEDAYKAAAEPKELMIIKGAVHTDLYDRMDKIPFDTISAFFAKSLK